MDAIGITLFESDGFGGWKVHGRYTPTIRSQKVCAGVIEIIPLKEIEKILEIKKMKNNETEFLGSLYGHGQSYAGAVWDSSNPCPTITTMQGGNRQPCTVEVKTLDEQNFFCDSTKQVKSETKVVKVKQATKEGSVEATLPACVDLNYVSSKTRRGRVQGGGQICPTLATENMPNILEEWTWEIDGEKYLIRIRKLTPKECFRLMGFCKQKEDGTWDDTNYYKAAQVVSNTQLYKQAGNSICVPVLEKLFENLIKG